MKTIDCAQNSEEWFAAKLGIPSASNFSSVLAKGGGVTRKKYMYRLAAERLSGLREDTYQNEHMLRGIELEDEAAKAYEEITGSFVETAGFYLLDDESAGCSPDRTIGNVGLLEIKCPMMKTQVGYFLDNKCPSEYVKQVQGQLWVTEREWCDFVSYCPELNAKASFLCVRVNRDEKLITEIAEGIKVFSDELNEMVGKLREGF